MASRLSSSISMPRPRRACEDIRDRKSRRLIAVPERLPKSGLQFVGKDTRVDVGHASGRKRHDNTDRSVRIALCSACLAEDRKRNSKAENSQDDAKHGLLRYATRPPTVDRLTAVL